MPVNIQQAWPGRAADHDQPCGHALTLAHSDWLAYFAEGVQPFALIEQGPYTAILSAHYGRPL